MFTDQLPQSNYYTGCKLRNAFEVAMKILNYLALLPLVLMTASCSMLGNNEHEPLHQSEQYYNYIQSSFTEYTEVTKTWLKANRDFISPDHDKELSMNMPFQLLHPKKSDKVVLFVHGLGDSPYSFSDLSQTLYQQGFDVQNLLLPGHGSKPNDLMLPHYSDWQEIVDHYADLLKKEYDNVWLGGFSTGGNLVTIHAIEQGDVDGLLLFSPGFQSRTPFLEKFAAVASVFTDGYSAQEQNLARYTSAPLNGAIAYVKSAQKLRALLQEREVTVPTLIALSEFDSVVDPNAVKTMFDQHFVSKNSQLIWYGEDDISGSNSNVKTLTMKHISTGSHMSPLFAPANAYYGVNGERRMCMNSFDDDAVQGCEQGKEVWFSAWGYEEEGKIHARLTWNPYYQELVQDISTIVQD